MKKNTLDLTWLYKYRLEFPLLQYMYMHLSTILSAVPVRTSDPL